MSQSVNATHSEALAVHSLRHVDLVVLEQRCMTRHALQPHGTLTVGRGADCDIVLRDPAASRRHAVLRVAADICIEDLGSRNGTLISGARLPARKPAPLGLGHSVQIGGSTLLLQPHNCGELRPRGADVRASAEESCVVISSDPAMRSIYDLIAKVAASSLTVLVVGETGVGKELVAESVHRRSGTRSANPFVRINCAALTPSLLESELFGHERGAFTGANHARAGLFEAAHGGTVFLDEVAELPFAAQAKLLRVLEVREVTRVGAVRARSIDVRFVAATNRDLRADVARGAFREDLYFRLAGATVRVPPLRQRPADIEPLVMHFASALCGQMGHPLPSFSAAALAHLRSHAWPGNVRELRNVVERAVLTTNRPILEPFDLLLDNAHMRVGAGAPLDTWPPPVPPSSQAFALSEVERCERDRILAALATCHGNQTRAANWLQMPRRTLVRKLAMLGIPRPQGSRQK
ncbi:MAG TPA: sigma 54-interacting transcriptional regulator [Polyangiaceae bacterium]|nr:sigma 54-interacting transcriptional regulator [Polyangiaceae bacterium]